MEQLVNLSILWDPVSYQVDQALRVVQPQESPVNVEFHNIFDKSSNPLNKVRLPIRSSLLRLDTLCQARDLQRDWNLEIEMMTYNKYISSTVI
jgi:hypothetical protein